MTAGVATYATGPNNQLLSDGTYRYLHDREGNMPILYVAIGRCLGCPLYLVQAREHLFVRWEEPAGERFNVEATTLGFSCRDDEHFRGWPKPIRDEDIRNGTFLRNLTPREEVAAFLRERGQCWLDNLQTTPGLEALGHAARLGPRPPGVRCARAIAAVLHRVSNMIGRERLLDYERLEGMLQPQGWECEVWPLAISHLERVARIHRKSAASR